MFIGIEASHANKVRRTGVEQVCWHIIEELKRAIPRHDARVVLYSNEPLRGALDILPLNWSAKVLRWPLKKGWSQFRLAWELLLSPPDIFLAPGQLVPFVCPKNTIVFVHDSAFRAVPSAYSLASRIYLHIMNALIIKKASLIITPSEFSKNELLKYYKYDGERIVTAPWGYDQAKFKQLAHNRQILTKYKLTKPFIMSVGRLEEKKNTRRIVQAFSIIRRKHDLQLLLAGTPGVGYEGVRREMAESPYKNDIIVPYWVDDDLPQLLNQAEVFIFPSLYEGFGLPVLEAMACGCPVVSSSMPALQEVGGQAANYVGAEDTEGIAKVMERLITDKVYRAEKITAGLARAKEFSWASAAEKAWMEIVGLLK